MTCAHSSGQGEITGPRSAIAKYEFTGCKTGAQKCESEGAEVEEIRTGLIEAELVYVDQKNREVAVLLNPHGGTYMRFECGGIPARGEGPFLALGGPLNTETTSFTTTLSKSSKSGGVQTPDEYEGAGGEKLNAVPLGEKNNNLLLEPTGVESTITVTTADPVEVRAITAEEVEAAQQAALKKQEEALKKSEEHAKQLEEANTQLAAAVKKDQAEIALTNRKLEELKPKSPPFSSPPPSRAKKLAKALRACERLPKKKRARCVASAHRKYGAKTTGKG